VSSSVAAQLDNRKTQKM